MPDLLDEQTFYWQVAVQAVAMGYSISQVALFKSDITDCFYDNKSVEETVNEVF